MEEMERQTDERMPPCKTSVDTTLSSTHSAVGSFPVFGITPRSTFHQGVIPCEKSSTVVSECHRPSSIDRYLSEKAFDDLSIQFSSGIDDEGRWRSCRAIDRDIDVSIEVSIVGGGGGHGARLFTSRIARDGTSHATRHEAKEGCGHPDPSEIEVRGKGGCAAGLPTRQA